MGLVKPYDWNINLCQGPVWDRADVLPRPFKDKVIEKIKQHIEWLTPLDRLTRATNGYQGMITFINQQDNSHNLGKFFEVNDKMDLVRAETFEDVFPEYKELRSYVK
jgi:hypothetical protein